MRRWGAAFHRLGIAAAMMADLLADRAEPYPTLRANPAGARRIYGGWGWQPAGTVHPPEVGPMDVLVKRLSGPE